MSGLGPDIELALVEMRKDFKDYPVDIYSMQITTGAGMYRQPSSATVYSRSGALALNPIAQYGERYPGGYHNNGRATVAFKASDNGSGGPTNRTLLLPTGAQTGLKLAIQDRFWRASGVTECRETDEIVVELEKIE
jgi:hypothetical protein